MSTWLTGASRMASLLLVSHEIMPTYVAHVCKVVHVLGMQGASHFDLPITVSFTADFDLTVFLF